VSLELFCLHADAINWTLPIQLSILCLQLGGKSWRRLVSANVNSNFNRLSTPSADCCCNSLSLSLSLSRVSLGHVCIKIHLSNSDNFIRCSNNINPLILNSFNGSYHPCRLWNSHSLTSKLSLLKIILRRKLFYILVVETCNNDCLNQ